MEKLETHNMNTCAIETDGDLKCRGYNYYGNTNIPADLGPVKEVFV